MCRSIWVIAATGCFCAQAHADPFVFEYAGPPVLIPDNPTRSGSVSVTVPGFANPIHEIRVQLLIEHPWQGDLKITFSKDQGPSLVLVDQPGYPELEFGFSSANFGDPWNGNFMEFRDGAEHRYDYLAGPCGTSGIKSVVGSWLPEGGSLQTTFGKHPLNGTWRLKVEDKIPGASGSILGFKILGQTVPEPATMLGIAIGSLGYVVQRRNRATATPSASRSH